MRNHLLVNKQYLFIFKNPIMIITSNAYITKKIAYAY